MNTKLCALIAIFGVVQSAYSAYLYGLSDSREGISDYDDVEVVFVGMSQPLKPPPPGMKYCQPGFCCPLRYDCRGLFCHDPITGNKEHSVLVC